MLKVVLASNNQGKIKEINQLMKEHDIVVVPQTLEGVMEIEETGYTFIENALIKARHASSMTHLPALADDSGLVVPALNGEPGIYSARYAGADVNHDKNIQKLLDNLEEVADEQRHAYFYCVIVFLMHAKDPCPIICEGVWHGKILFKPQGDNGFGYDPIFYDSDHQRSAAELPSEIKNSISHRGQAIRKLLARLPNQLEYSSD